MKWMEIRVVADADSSEVVCDIFQRFGCGGVAVDGEYVVTPEGEVFANVEHSLRVRAYLPVDELLEEKRSQIDEALGRLSAIYPLRSEGKVIDEEEWAEAFKAYFKTFSIGECIVVKPSWEDYTPRGREVVIELDPGLAFGTGLHPSTRMCLAQMERLIRPGKTVLDLGTGSGILSIAAAKLGAAPVLALDIDPVAVRVAGANIASNGVSKAVRVQQGTLPDRSSQSAWWGSFDLVFVNILAEIICNLADSLVGALKPGGVLIAGGIISNHLDEVTSRLRDAGAEVVEVVEDGVWRVVMAQA